MRASWRRRVGVAAAAVVLCLGGIALSLTSLSPVRAAFCDTQPQGYVETTVPSRHRCR